MSLDIHTTVSHKLYGQGEVVKVTANKLYVIFGEKQRIFPYPEAFDKGFLSTNINLADTEEETANFSNSKERTHDPADMSSNVQHISELRRYMTREMFENAYDRFIKQADENAISKKSKGSKSPYGIVNGNGERSFDGAGVGQHFGQGAASKTPYINWWVVSIYYIYTDNGSIILGIEEDRYPHIRKMKPLRYEQIGNKKTNVAVFYESTKDTINYDELYEMFLKVSEEVMELGMG